MAVDPQSLNDISEVRILLANAERLGRDDLILACIERLGELRTTGFASELEVECWKAIYVAEELQTLKRGKTVHLQRTINKIREQGVLKTISDIAGSPKIREGFNILRDGNKIHLTFEYICLKYEGDFSEEVRAEATRKLVKAGVELGSLPSGARFRALGS